MTSSNEFDHEHEPNAGQGEWVSNEPTVDDFNDPAAGSASASEDSEQVHEELIEADETKKKKFPVWLMFGTVAGLAAAAVAYMQFSAHPDEATKLLDMSSKNTVQNVAAPHFSSSPATQADPVTQLKAMAPAIQTAPKSAFNAAPPSPVPPPATVQADIPPAVMDSKAPDAVPPAPSVESMAPMGDEKLAPKAIDTMNTVQLPEKPANPMVTAPAPTPVSPAPAVGTMPASASDDHVKALQDKVDNLQKALADTTSQLSTISTKLAAKTSATVASQPDAATAERVEKLEQKLKQLEQQQTSASVSSTAKASMDSSLLDNEPKVKKQPAPAVRKGVIGKKPAKTATHVAAKSGWVLRAATTDEAWVAKDSSTREMRPVHVGDILPGIGKVRSIRMKGDVWVVEGSAGSVR